MKNLRLTELLEQFKAETKQQAIRLIAQRSDRITATSSKFGGLPYLPKNFAYPTDKKGNPLKLLAQLNFAELPLLADFPTSGILQFFVLPTDVIGLADWDGELTKTGDVCQVFYHKEILPHSEIMTDFPKIEWIDEEDEEIFPFQGEVLVTGEFTDIFINNTTIEFRELFKEFCLKYGIFSHFESHFWRWKDWRNWYEKKPTLSQEEQEKSDEKFREIHNAMEIFACDNGHLIGGYPNFVSQEHEKLAKLAKYNTLLFQISSSDLSIKPADEIEDNVYVIGNFFIKSADLQKLKFDDVYFQFRMLVDF